MARAMISVGRSRLVLRPLDEILVGARAAGIGLGECAVGGGEVGREDGTSDGMSAVYTLLSTSAARPHVVGRAVAVVLPHELRS